MSKSSPSPPPAPDPQATASAQSTSNINTAIANARLNRVNQTTPWGSISYTQGPADASGVPTYSSQIQLSPQQQALLDAQQQQQLQRQQLGSSFLNQVSAQPLNLGALHPMQSRGQSYAGAVNAPGQPPAPQGQSPQGQQGQSPLSQLDPQTLAAIVAALQPHINPQSVGNPLARPQQPQQATPAQQPQANAAGSAAQGSSLSYADYQNAVLKNFAAQGQANPSPDSYASQSDWARMSPKDQYDNMLMSAPAQADPQGGPGNTMPAKYLPAGQDASAAFTARFGKPNGPLDYSVGDPTNYGQPSSQWANDPSRFLTMPDGTRVFEGNNVSGDFLRQAQATDDRRSNQFMTRGAATIGGMAAGSMFGPGVPTDTPPAGTGAFDVGGSTGFGGSTPIGGNYAPVTDLSGASAGAPVSDLSTQATQPGIGSRMLTNLQQGRGLLGMRTPATSGISALVSLLRGGNGK